MVSEGGEGACREKSVTAWWPWIRTIKYLFVLASSEEREAGQKMEEASTIKLALVLAVEKKWHKVSIHKCFENQIGLADWTD